MNHLNFKPYWFLSLLTIMFFASCQKEQTLLSEQYADAKIAQKLNEFSLLGGSQIKVLSYNTFLLNDLAFVRESQWSQNTRAEKLGDADFIKNYDVLLLQECFDNTACTSLRKKLSVTYPYLTPVLGQTKQGWNNTLGDWREIISLGIQNGGVMIASKYPIQYMDQYIFPIGCDYDGLALKGFIYVRILKDSKPIHFIATHLQSTQKKCNGSEVQIRENQLKAIKTYVDNLKIPKDEMLIYGGDFNIIKDEPEYQKMLNLLNVSAPTYKGLPFTWDTKTNTMAAYHYPYPVNKQEYVDYIFVSSEHLVPPVWQNVVFDPVSPDLMTYNPKQGEYYWTDYSDHYPVEGNIYSDETTPKRSLKLRMYDKVSLKSVKTGKYISANLLKTDDWLKVSATVPDESTWFNLVNTDGGNYFDLKAGKVRVEISERINNFWFWNLLNGGDYYYFPKFGESLKSLELVLIKKKNGKTSASIEDGDIVSFRDFTLTGNTYYLQVHNKSGTDWLYLNGTSAGNSEQFEIKFNKNTPLNW